MQQEKSMLDYELTGIYDNKQECNRTCSAAVHVWSVQGKLSGVKHYHTGRSVKFFSKLKFFSNLFKTFFFPDTLIL